MQARHSAAAPSVSCSHRGANATLLGSTAYSAVVGSTTAIVVLSCWALAGTALIVVAGLRRRT